MGLLVFRWVSVNNSSILKIVLTSITATKPHTIPSKQLAEMIKRTMFAISQDETRYTYNGVFMESENQILRLVATDGHRLALIEREEKGIQLANGVILHKKGLGELTKLLQTDEDDAEEMELVEDPDWNPGTRFWVTMDDEKITELLSMLCWE